MQLPQLIHSVKSDTDLSLVWKRVT